MINNFINRCFSFLISGLNLIGDSYYTFHTRPKLSDHVSISRFENQNLINKNILVAIVIQGPVIIKDNFTKETLKLYLKFFPNQKIILSTGMSTIKEINKALVLLNKYG